MKILPILVPGVLAGALLSAVVFAAPIALDAGATLHHPMDRSAAYSLAVAS